MEDFIKSLSQLNPLWVYIAVAGVAYLENVFPPFPSDVIVVAAGSLVGIGTVNFGVTLLVTTVGSTLGFMTMYKVGDWFGKKILETGKIKFIPLESVHRVEDWFRRYGYWVVVVNRFLAGTRAVVSFFVGMSKLSISRSAILCFLSALVWNFLLLFAGKELGENWRSVLVYLEAYGKTITVAVFVAIIVILGRQVFLKRPSSSSQGPSTHS
jgi:membrane protein DedA with SNARE-associated domain